MFLFYVCVSHKACLLRLFTHEAAQSIVWQPLICGKWPAQVTSVPLLEKVVDGVMSSWGSSHSCEIAGSLPGKGQVEKEQSSLGLAH